MDAVPAGWEKAPLPQDGLLGTPKSAFLGHLPNLRAGTNYFFGLPVSAETAGRGEIIVTIVRRSHGFPRSVSVTRSVIADGQEFHVGASLDQLRADLLRAHLEEKGISPVEIESRVRRLQQSGAVTSGSFGHGR